MRVLKFTNFSYLIGPHDFTTFHIFHGKRTEIYSSEFPLNRPCWIYSWFLGSLIGEYDQYKQYRMYHGGWVSNHHPLLRSRYPERAILQVANSACTGAKNMVFV
jgi:hypothetical protein